MDFSKAIIKEAGRMALAAYENPANIDDLMFAIGRAALDVFRTAEQDRLEREAEEEGQRWHDSREHAGGKYFAS